jgi:hypothetical protein
MKRERQVCRYIRTGFGFRLPRNLEFSVRIYRVLVFKFFKISGVNLDFRGVKKRQGGGERNFPLSFHVTLYIKMEDTFETVLKIQ